MTPKFILAANYAPRDMQLVLAPAAYPKKGWQFYGTDGSLSVLARNPKGDILCTGTIFKTKGEAAFMALALELPAYAVWNGRTKTFDGKGAMIRAYPHGYEEIQSEEWACRHCGEDMGRFKAICPTCGRAN